MAKAFRFKFIGSLLMALLISPLASAAGLTLNSKSFAPIINENTKSLPDLSKPAGYNFKNKVTQPEAWRARTRLILEKLKMTTGGSDSGGGQGVYDMRTGQVRFVDILSKEELQQMQLARNPEKQVFARFPKCTKSVVQYFPIRYNAEMQRIPEVILENVGLYLEHFNFEIDYATTGGLREMITSFKLRQLKDATIIAPEYQLQLGIYNDGVSFFQQQALILMPFEDFKWLLVKEALRYLAYINHFPVDNREVEEALRLIYNKNGPALAETTYYLKLMRPHFDRDESGHLLPKKEFIEKRLRKADLSPEERELWENDLADIKLKESKDFDDFLVPERLRIKSRLSAEHMLSDDRIEDAEIHGIIPAWALKFGQDQDMYYASRISGGKGYKSGTRRYRLRDHKNLPEAPMFRAYDIETGETILKTGDCSK